jgi:putative addiction module component (TIGR02574 family)
MSGSGFDFSHLSPEERLQLAGDLWDSVAESDAVVLSDAQVAELRRRLARLERDGARAESWRATLDRIDQSLRSRDG